MSPGQLAAMGLSAGAGLLASPYLARLSLTVPDRENRRWWLGAPTGSTRWLAAAATALVLALLGGHGVGWSALLPAWIGLAISSAPLVLIDFEHHRLPDRLVFVAAGSTAVLLLLAAVLRSDWADLARAAEAAVAVFVVFFVIALVAPFGFGDVKLGAVLAGALGWFSWGYVIYGILAGFILASVASLPLVALRRASMKSAIPLGPALILGTFVVVAFQLVPSYLR
jgi:leader peptidase (prepilin peptidase)/N-methyltransferase